MRGRSLCPEYGHDGDDAEADERLDQRVALDMPDGGTTLHGLATVIAHIEAWLQAQPVDRRQGHHDREQRDFEKKKLTIESADQSRNRPDKKPRIDGAGYQQSRNAT